MKEGIDVIRNIAPTLAVALQGPFAGVASKFIIERLSGDNLPDPSLTNEEIINRLLTDTENLKKLKVIDEPFLLEMRGLGVDVFALKLPIQQRMRKCWG